jgi:hypothetical protein
VFNITLDARDAIRQLSDFPDQVRFASSLAINKTAQQVKKDLQKEMKRVFDRPTPYTLNGLFIAPSTKQHLQAEVWLKGDGSFAPSSNGTAQVKYLSPEIFGGERKPRSSELDLRRADFLEDDMFTTPGYEFEQKLDRYGNVPSSVIMRMITNLKIQQEDHGVQQNQTASSKKRRKGRAEYFVMGKNPGLGVFRRKTGSDDLESVLWFVKKPHYQKRFDFFGVAEKSAAEHMPKELVKAVRFALATAR